MARTPASSKRTRKTTAPVVSAGSKRKAALRRRRAATPDRRRQPRESLRLRSFEPSFTVNDLGRSVRFYTEVLGFALDEQWTDGPVLKGVMVKAGLCQLGLTQDDWAKGRDRVKGQGMSLWGSTVQDIDALAARIKAAGGTLTAEPTDQPWGARTLSVDDPDGFHLTIYREP
jgi:lactoylglutathione lyase